jgi:glycosyltransferase involved in cell wall biosynthesis
LKFVLISKYASYPPYGMETRQLYLSREIVARGHDVDVYTSTANHFLTSKPNIILDEFGGVNIHWIKTKDYQKPYGISRIISWIDFEWKLFFKLRKATLNNQDTVLVSSLSLLSIWNGVRLKKKFGCKLVFEIRDIWPLVLSRISNVSKLNPFYLMLGWLEKYGYRNADLIIGTMPNLISHVKNTVSISKKIIWIPHLINHQVSYKPDNSYKSFFDELRNEFKDKITCYAGSINKSSGLKYIIEAFNQKKLSNHALILLGDGPEREYLKTLAKTKNIFFLDKVSQNEVVGILKQCDFLYDGYLKSELYTFGTSRNKYVEYCLAGRPMLISYEGYPLFVQEYNCGKVVKPESKEAIIEGLQELSTLNFKSRENLGKNALKFAKQNLNVKEKVNQILECIKVG